MKVKYLVHSTILGVVHQKEKCGLYFMRPGTNEIVEQFQPIDIKTNGAWDGKRIQCYVTCSRYIPACAVIPQERRNDVVQGS